LGGKEGGGEEGKRGGREKAGEMAQTLYAHMHKIKKIWSYFSSLPSSGGCSLQHKPSYKHNEGVTSLPQTGVKVVNLNLIYLMHCKNFLNAEMYHQPAQQ
jgi:hypothetical protein